MYNLVFFVLCVLGITNGFPLIREDEPELFTEDMTTMGHGGGGGHDMEMKMYFHSTAHATILFQGWHTMNWWELLLSCIGVAVFAVAYEGLKYSRERMMSSSSKNKITITNEKANGDAKFGSNTMMVATQSDYETVHLFSLPHILQTLLHFLQMFVGYSLMMVFMTFNIYLCIFVCIGGAVGYFIFGPRKIFKGISECCD